MLRRILLGAIALVALGACGEDAVGPVVGAGSLSFDYTGGLPGELEGGAFSVSGAPRLSSGGRPEPAEWATAGPHPLEGPLVPVGSKLAIVAFAPRGAGEGDEVVLTLPRVSAPATIPIEGDCTALSCARGVFLLGVDPRAPHDGLDGSCDLIEGVLEVTSVSATRIRGTFSATGRCTHSLRDGPFFDLTVRAGAFDVEISGAFRSGLRIWS